MAASPIVDPGFYVLVCFVPSPDGIPHLAKGMVWPLTVAEEASGAPEPDVDVEMELTDYDFKLSQEVAPGEQAMQLGVSGVQYPVVIMVIEAACGASDFSFNGGVA